MCCGALPRSLQDAGTYFVTPEMSLPGVHDSLSLGIASGSKGDGKIELLPGGSPYPMIGGGGVQRTAPFVRQP